MQAKIMPAWAKSATPSAGFRRCKSGGLVTSIFPPRIRKGSVSGFNLGQFVLHLASPLSEKVSYFGEVSFTAQPNGYDLSVERTIIRYDYNDYFKISFGKYHTPIGYWNAAFHHGAWLQTTIARPGNGQVSVEPSFPPTLWAWKRKEIFPPAGLAWGTTWDSGTGARRC